MWELALIRLQCLLHTLPSTLLRLRGYTRRRCQHSLYSQLHTILGLRRQTIKEFEIVRLDRFKDKGFEFAKRRWEWDI